MERGLYAAATGMASTQAMQDTLASNLANASTTAYKQDSTTFQSIQGQVLSRYNNGSGEGVEVGELGAGSTLDSRYIDWKQGALVTTDRALDVSLGEGQFFGVQAQNGVRYSRAGALQVGAAGDLSTESGLPILGEDGNPINVGNAKDVSIDGAGNVLAGNRKVAKLMVMDADTRYLQRAGDNLFESSQPNTVRPATNPVVRPKTLEASNFDMVTGMIRLITVARSFDMAQKAVTTQDELLRQAATEVGKV